MARPLRVEFAGAWYHVMNRGAGKRPVFASARHHATFLRATGEVSRIYGIEVHAYCLMLNHYHLLVRTPAAGLGRAMRHLGSVYTQRFNRSVKTDGALFRGRYKALLVSEDSYLLCASRYIHLNPVEGALVARPEDHAASSYRAFLGLEPAPEWLHTTETLRYFAPGDLREGYRRFVQAGIDAETRAFYADPPGPVFGSDEFRTSIEERVRIAGVRVEPEVPGARSVTERPPLAEVAAAVCCAFRISVAELRAGSGRVARYPHARGAFVCLGRELGGHPLGTLARWAGYATYAAASKSMTRFAKAMRADPELQATFATARGQILTGDSRGQDRAQLQSCEPLGAGLSQVKI